MVLLLIDIKFLNGARYGLEVFFETLDLSLVGSFDMPPTMAPHRIAPCVFLDENSTEGRDYDNVITHLHSNSSLVRYITRNGMIGIRGRCYITWVRGINYTRDDLIYPSTIMTLVRSPEEVKHALLLVLDLRRGGVLAT